MFDIAERRIQPLTVARSPWHFAGLAAEHPHVVAGIPELRNGRKTEAASAAGDEDRAHDLHSRVVQAWVMHKDLPTTRGTYSITTDADRMDAVAIHAALDQTYWAAGRPLHVVERSIAGSVNFGLFDPAGAQVGFTRVVTDHATFAWICDVYVLEAHRGLALGKALMAAVIDHPDLQGIRRMMLATADAHGLYAQYGFEPLDQPERFMARARA